MWTGISPIFWSNLFTHVVLCGHFASDRPFLPRRNSRHFFLRRFGSHLVLCGRFPSDRSSLPRQNSRQFFRNLFFSHSVLWGHFLRINLLCLDRTLAIFLRNNRQCPDFLLWFSTQKMKHSDVVLGSFWSHFEIILGSAGPLWSFWGPSGVLLGSKGSPGESYHLFSTTVLGPFLDLFSLCSHFDVKKCNSNYCKIQCLFPGRFLIDFCTILRSDLEVQNGRKCSK